MHLLSSTLEPDLNRGKSRGVMITLTGISRWLPLALCVSMAAVLLAGCGSETPATSRPTSPATSTPTAPAASTPMAPTASMTTTHPTTTSTAPSTPMPMAPTASMTTTHPTSTPMVPPSPTLTALGTSAEIQPPTAVPTSTSPPEPTSPTTQAPVEVGYRAGQKAPDFALTTVDGEQVTLAGLQGQPAVLYFFATW